MAMAVACYPSWAKLLAALLVLTPSPYITRSGVEAVDG